MVLKMVMEVFSGTHSLLTFFLTFLQVLSDFFEAVPPPVEYKVTRWYSFGMDLRSQRMQGFGPTQQRKLQRH